MKINHSSLRFRLRNQWRRTRFGFVPKSVTGPTHLEVDTRYEALTGLIFISSSLSALVSTEKEKERVRMLEQLRMAITVRLDKDFNLSQRQIHAPNKLWICSQISRHLFGFCDVLVQIFFATRWQNIGQVLGEEMRSQLGKF